MRCTYISTGRTPTHISFKNAIEKLYVILRPAGWLAVKTAKADSSQGSLAYTCRAFLVRSPVCMPLVFRPSSLITTKGSTGPVGSSLSCLHHILAGHSSTGPGFWESGWDLPPSLPPSLPSEQERHFAKTQCLILGMLGCVGPQCCDRVETKC